MRPQIAIAALVFSAVTMGCTAEVEVITDPVSQTIPMTSLLVPVYAEIALDLPPETQGDVEPVSITATATVVNATTGSTMELDVRLSFTGTATPTAPVVFAGALPPASFASAIPLIDSRQFAGNSRTPVNINAPELAQVLGKKRIWLIVSNTVTQRALLDSFPMSLELEDMIVRAIVTKSFDGLGGAQELSGL